jgi:predicted DCC family thiol-disulfide oxidoreductase YuxK
VHKEKSTDSAGDRAAGPARGWLAYDAECPFCSRTARRVEGMIARRGYAIIPLQTPWVQERLGLRPGDPLREMVVLTNDGRRLGGVAAALHLARFIWWAWPVRAFATLPGALVLLRRIYARVAAHRSCGAGACALSSKPAQKDFL